GAELPVKISSRWLDFPSSALSAFYIFGPNRHRHINRGPALPGANPVADLSRKSLRIASRYSFRNGRPRNRALYRRCSLLGLWHCLDLLEFTRPNRIVRIG